MLVELRFVVGDSEVGDAQWGYVPPVGMELTLENVVLGGGARFLVVGHAGTGVGTGVVSPSKLRQGPVYVLLEALHARGPELRPQLPPKRLRP